MIKIYLLIGFCSMVTVRFNIFLMECKKFFLQPFWTDVEIHNIKSLNNTDGAIIIDLKIKRIKKGEFGIAGTVDIKADFNHFDVCTD